MRKYFQDRVITRLVDAYNRRLIVLGVGVATFFFGFAAGALLNMYLILTGSPLFASLRTTLSYKSAIFGDGILLPVINMIAASFLLKHADLIRKKTIRKALFFGVCVTVYFHITQAMGGIVNWAMPKPWHWNILGVWHGVYMFFVASLLSLFYLVMVKKFKKEKHIGHIAKEFFIVSVGLVIFFVLLRLDYITISIGSLIPHF